MKSIIINDFESDILKVACLIGLTRSVIEVVSDLLATELLPNFYLDLSLIVLFAGGLIATQRKLSFKWLLSLFYIPFIILLTIMFLDGRGLSHSIENNVFAGLVILTFTTKGKTPLYLNLAFIGCILITLVFLEFQYKMLEEFVALSSGKFNFVFSSLGIIAFTLYAKSEFNKSKRKLADAIIFLDQRTQSLKQKSKELLAKKLALDELTIELNGEVNSRSELIKTQRVQVEKYLSITLTELFDAYQDTIKAVDQFNNHEDEDSMSSMVVKSGEKLSKEMESLRTKISESL